MNDFHHLDSLSLVSRRQMFGLGLGLAAAGTIGSESLYAQSRDYGIRGQLAPELKVPYWIGADGEPTAYSLAEQEGKWIVLKYFQSWCPGCHKHGFPTLKKIVDAFGDHPQVSIASVQTVFEGFYTNTQNKVRKIQLDYGLTIPMGHDEGNPDGDHRPTTMKEYRTGGTPWIVIVGPNRQVLFNHFSLDADKFIAFLREQLA